MTGPGRGLGRQDRGNLPDFGQDTGELAAQGRPIDDRDMVALEAQVTLGPDLTPEATQELRSPLKLPRDPGKGRIRRTGSPELPEDRAASEKVRFPHATNPEGCCTHPSI